MSGTRNEFLSRFVAGFVVMAVGASTGALASPVPMASDSPTMPPLAQANPADDAQPVPAPVLQGQAGDRVVLKNDNPRRDFSWRIAPGFAAGLNGAGMHNPRTVKVTQSRGQNVGAYEIEYSADAVRALAGATVTLEKTRDGGVVAKMRVDNRDHELTVPAAVNTDPAEAFRAAHQKYMQELMQGNGGPMMGDNDRDSRAAYDALALAVVENLGLFTFNPFRHMLGRSTTFRVGDSVPVSAGDVPVWLILGAQDANVEATSRSIVVDINSLSCSGADVTVAGTHDENGKTFVVFRAQFTLVTQRYRHTVNGATPSGRTVWTWEGYLYFEQESGWFAKMDGTMAAEHFDPAGNSVRTDAALGANLAWPKR